MIPKLEKKNMNRNTIISCINYNLYTVSKYLLLNCFINKTVGRKEADNEYRSTVSQHKELAGFSQHLENIM